MADSDPINFTRGAAERIANAVRTVEIGSRGAGSIEWDVQRDQTPFRLTLAKFTGTWESGTYKTVTLHGSTLTASVFNWTDRIVVTQTESTSCERFVVFGRVRGTNTVLEASMQPFCTTCVMQFGSVDLTAIAGYSSTNIQVLGHNSNGPCLEWYSITTCATATSS